MIYVMALLAAPVAIWLGYVSVTGFVEGFIEGYKSGRRRRPWFRVYCEDEDETEEMWRNL